MIYFHKTKILFIILLVATIVFAIFSIFTYYQLNKTSKQLNSEKETNEQLKKELSDYKYTYRTDSSKVGPTPTKLDRMGNGSLTHFKTKIYPQFPDFQKEVTLNEIKHVLQFPVKTGNDPNGIGGFLVEVSKTAGSTNKYSFYLVTSTIQKRLINPMSAYADSKGIYCSLKDYEIVGNELGLGRKLTDENGYLIMTGTCEGYGGGRFISVYKISTAEKVPLKGNVNIVGTTYKGVSETGNALGNLRGIYGVNNPTLVVGFGSEESAGSTLEYYSSIGFFDLQTGNLKDLTSFN